MSPSEVKLHRTKKSTPQNKKRENRIKLQTNLSNKIKKFTNIYGPISNLISEKFADKIFSNQRFTMPHKISTIREITAASGTAASRKSRMTWRSLAGDALGADHRRRRVHQGVGDYLLGALKRRRERGALAEVLRRCDRWVVTHIGAWSNRDGLWDLITLLLLLLLRRRWLLLLLLAHRCPTIRLTVAERWRANERRTVRRCENGTTHLRGTRRRYARKGNVYGRLASERTVLSRGIEERHTAQASAVGCAAVLVRKLVLASDLSVIRRGRRVKGAFRNVLTVPSTIDYRKS